MIRRHFSAFLLLFYSLLGLSFLSWSTDNVVQALRHVTHYIASPLAGPPLAALSKLGEFGRNMARLVDLDQTYRALERRGLLLKLEELRLQALERENERLTGLLGVEPKPRFSPLVARVWARETVHGFHSLIIHKGERDGVRTADPVILLEGDREALVGQVSEVFSKTSRILLLTDPSSIVSAVVPRTGEQGSAEGAGPSRVILNYLFADTDVKPGDEVFTAGLGDIFPAGLWVGTVENMENPGHESFRRAWVRPAAKVGRASEVLVLLREAEDIPQ